MALLELARRYPGLRLKPGQKLRFHPNTSFGSPQVLTLSTSPPE